jgi:hypothetical protein
MLIRSAKPVLGPYRHGDALTVLPVWMVRSASGPHRMPNVADSKTLAGV